MRVAINARFLRHPATGTGRYLRSLARALGDVTGDDEFVLLGVANDAVPQDLGASFRCGTTGTSPRFLGANLAKLWDEQVAIPAAARREDADVLHYPYFAAPLRSAVPVVATVHDLIPLLLPPYRGSLYAKSYTRLVSRAVRGAAVIITDSEHSKRDIEELLDVPAARIRVIPLAVEPRFRPVEPGPEMEMVRAKYGLAGDFVLYLGGFDWRKNVFGLIEAFAEVKRRAGSGNGGRHGCEITLVVAGEIPRPSPLFPDPRRAVQRLNLNDSVKFIGAVPEDETHLLYNLAKVFVFPSLYEGFGLPPLEAMACGTPVVSSNRSSLPEVVGDAAITVDPADTSALADAIVSVIAQPGLSWQLRQKGVARAKRFSWEQVARQTMEVYREAGRR